MIYFSLQKFINFLFFKSVLQYWKPYDVSYLHSFMMKIWNRITALQLWYHSTAIRITISGNGSDTNFIDVFKF